MTVKQLGFACCQFGHKPFALSFHVPLFFWPDSARGSRVILPSGVNVILNLVPLGEYADVTCALTRLRPRCGRPCCRRAAEQRDELAASHSITSSAMERSDGGTVRPSIRAVCALMTSWNLDGWTIGKSAGLAPLSMRPV